MPNVLIIDDDTELCELVSQFLSQEGFSVESVHDGDRGSRQAVSGKYSIVVLDVMLPGINGFDVLRRIREESRVPVIMLTARGEEVDRIVGLEIGADDYMPKPFNPRELAARMRAILRRTNNGHGADGGDRPERLRIGDLELEPGARVVFRAGEEIPLTGIEFTLLESLVRDAGQVITREALSRLVLDRRHNPFDRSLDVHVSNLRKKLGPQAGGQERIKTIRGRGYMYVKRGDQE